MSDSQNPTNQPADNEPSTQDQPQPSVEELIAERDKWKALSRQNEERWKQASRERDELKQASMTEAEKALEQAKQEARSSALAEVGQRLVEAELRSAAATAGVQLPPTEFINTSSLVGDDGLPNMDRVKAFVESLPKPAAGPRFSQDLGLGRQGSGTPGQLTREDLVHMTPQEIMKARKEGRLDELMRGRI